MTKMNFSFRSVMLCMVVLVSVSVHAAFSLTHKTGNYDALQPNGMQSVHTEYQILYARPGDVLHLYRVDRATFVSYVRWYCYDTDRTVPATYSAEDSPTGVACNRIEIENVKDTTKLKYKNNYGWFGIRFASDRVTTKDSCYLELKYTMHNGDSIYRIACDQSVWEDFTWNISKATTEPTLSKRVIYEIRPAKWMADSLEQCKVSPENPGNDKYLEEYELIAPIGRQLYIGPEYMYRGSGKQIKLPQYYYYCQSNYFYINSQGNVTKTDQDKNWKWYKDGVEDASITLGNLASQFAPVSSLETGTVTYTLKYNSATGYYFNVARFHVTFMDTTVVGPVAKLPPPTKKMDKIYEETFNYARPGTTDFAFWRGHYDVDESTYGYYNKNLDETTTTSQRRVRKQNVSWSEYAVTNAKAMYTTGTNDPRSYQHVDSTANIEANAKEGYMLYCDGSQQPGQVFNLKVKADLCPGSTMYFSAYLCDISSIRTYSTSNNTYYRSAPNMDFVVTGIDADGKEHALTTFTTGEFGINAVKTTAQAPSISNRMERGKWYQIMFPVKFESKDIYDSYRLKIMNKSTSSDGNDFAIDDIRIYVQKPPVMPIQASTADCVDKAVDSIRAYLRIDYQEIEHNGEPIYYQWRDAQNNILRTHYSNKDSVSTTFGCIPILPTDEAIEASGLTCASLLAFDAQFRETKVPVYRYVKEKIDNTTERYVLYIAQPIVVRPNYIYTGFVALQKDGLGSRDGCGTFADMLIAGGTRITINGDITLGDSVVSVCGHRDYTLNIVLTQIIQDTENEELKIDTTHCKADWLVGDSAYVNAHPEIYKNSFAEIESALIFYRTNPEHVATRNYINYLLRQGLLVLDTASIKMQASVSLTYTAFPLAGSAGSKQVCTSPRFLRIQPSTPMTSMMAVGAESEEASMPAVVKARPRVVRISNAQKNTGEFTLPTYRKGSDENYDIDTIIMVGSTNPTWEPIGLEAESKDAEHPRHVGAKDSLHIHGDNLKGLEAGYDYTFHVKFEDEDSGCERGYTYFTLRIVPDVVTWRGGDWNNDESWDYFIPLAVTDVVLMPDSDYNVNITVADSIYSYDFNYTRNQCRKIYLPAGASMKGQEQITINDTAFVDIRPVAGKWNLMSVPIQGIVTGDLFASQSESVSPFEVAHISQTVDAAANDRHIQEIYCSAFDASTDKWLRADSTLDRPIAAGEAVMIGADCASDPVIRLPKADDTYRYYNITTGKWLGDEDVSVTRDENLGKPVFTGSTTITLKETYNGAYLFGNPTFGYLDIKKLVADNADKLTGEYYMASAGGTAAPNTWESITFNHNTTEAGDHLLPPYQGILLKGKSSSNTLTVNVSAEAVTPAPKRREAAVYRAPVVDGFNYGDGMPVGAKGIRSVPTVNERDNDITAFFTPKVGQNLPILIIERTLYKDGDFNTLCLPFDMDAAAIAESDLAGCQLYEFTGAVKVSDSQLDISMNRVYNIEAGVPYLIRWDNTGEVITELVFHNVYITTDAGLSVGYGIKFVGNICRAQMNYNDHDNLFVGSGNTLQWPNTTNPLRGFRAYFTVPTGGSMSVRRGTPARVVLYEPVPTATEENTVNSSVRKVMRNGMLYIIRDDKRYNVFGQNIFPME